MFSSAKITDLLEKTGQIDQCQRLDRVMMRLAEFDKGLDRDRRAVDETKKQHGGDEADKPVLDKYFKKMWLIENKFKKIKNKIGGNLVKFKIKKLNKFHII